MKKSYRDNQLKTSDHIKNLETMTYNPSIRVYNNKIENRKTFKLRFEHLKQ